MPPAEVRHVHFIEIGTTEGDVRGTGKHGAFAILGEERHFSARRDAINVVRSVTGDVEVSGSIQCRAIRHVVKFARIHPRPADPGRRKDGNGQNIVRGALDDEERFLIGAKGKSIGKCEAVEQLFDLPIRPQDENEAVVGAPLAGVAEIEIALVVEDGEVRGPETVAADSFPGAYDLAGAIQMNQGAEFEIADVQILAGGEGKPEVEAAKGGDQLNFAPSIDPIDLTQFAAGPEVAITVEGETFGMIQSVGENLEAVELASGRHDRFRLKHITFALVCRVKRPI